MIRWRPTRGAQWWHTLISTVVASLVAGCGALTKTSYERPALAIPADWTTSNRTARDAVGMDPWWYAFGDHQLNAVIEKMLRGNQALEMTAMAVSAAWEAVAFSESNELPLLTFGATNSTSKLVGQRSREANDQTQNFASSRTSRSKTFSSSLGYRFDLWGTLASHTAATQWQAKATEQDWADLVLHQIGATIILYGNLAYISEQLERGQRSVEHAQSILRLVTARYHAGSASSKERLMAEQTLIAQESAYTALESHRMKAQNALSLLLGNVISTPMAVPAQTLAHVLPDVPLGLPVRLLSRRPDLRAAEMRLRASLHELDSLRSSFYPLSLGVSLSSTSISLQKLLATPTAMLDAIFSLPNLWNSNASVRMSMAAREGEIAAFKQRIYSAIGDVKNALADRDGLAAQAVAQARSVELAIEIERKSELAYRAGSFSFQFLLDSQESRRIAESTLIGIRFSQWTNQVDLYLALGGGFEDPATNIALGKF